MNKKVSDDQIRRSYLKTRSVWQTGRDVGLSGQTVQQRVVQMGQERFHKKFSDEEIKQLEREYLTYRDAGKLDVLAKRMGRTKQFLARQAGKLGLTSYSHQRRYQAVWKYMDAETAGVIMDDFKDSSYNMKEYCTAKGYDDLGFSRTMKKFFPDEWDITIESKVKRQSKYRLGRSFEYSVRDRLRKADYYVMRSPASRSPIDLVAIKNGDVLMVQCKLGAMAPKEWNALFDEAAMAKAIPIYATRGAGKRHEYYRMTDRKDGSKRPQPMEPWSIT